MLPKRGDCRAEEYRVRGSNKPGKDASQNWASVLNVDLACCRAVYNLDYGRKEL